MKPIELKRPQIYSVQGYVCLAFMASVRRVRTEAVEEKCPNETRVPNSKQSRKMSHEGGAKRRRLSVVLF